MTARIDNEFRVVRRRRVTEPEQREEKGIRLAEGMDIMLNDPHRHAAVLRACEIGLALRGAYTTEEKIQLRKEIKEHLTALHGSFATLADRDKLLKAYLGDGDDITHAEMESDYVMPRSEGGEASIRRGKGKRGRKPHVGQVQGRGGPDGGVLQGRQGGGEAQRKARHGTVQVGYGIYPGRGRLKHQLVLSVGYLILQLCYEILGIEAHLLLSRPASDRYLLRLLLLLAED